MARVVEAAEAVRQIDSGSWVIFGGSGGGHGVPETVIAALADRFKECGEPRDLTLISVVSLGDWAEAGFNRLAVPGLALRVITAGLNNCPRLADLAARGEIDAHLLPQGVLSQLCREMAAGRPGLITRVGMHTFVDPRVEGVNTSRSGLESLVEAVRIGAEEYLLYRCLPVDVAVIRGTTADEKGNISAEEEAYFGENLSIAAAVRRRGGIVIAQVKRLGSAGSLPGKQVKVPGMLVDYVVVDPDQFQTYQVPFNPGYAGELRVPAGMIAPLEHSTRKVIARRAAMELHPGDVVNLGFGVSHGIGPVALEEGIVDQITLTVEQGIIGGVPASGKDAGAGINYDAMIDQPYLFDLYDGGGLDIAFLSFAQVGPDGSVNVSRFAGRSSGPGGFINISQGTPVIVFSGTLTTGGLAIEPDGREGVVLRREGRDRKWVADIEQVTFSGPYALERGQNVTYITDRAVFRLTGVGLELVEIAAGVDLERDVLGCIGFPVRVSSTLKPMDSRLFRDATMGLLPEFQAKGPRRIRAQHNRE